MMGCIRLRAYPLRFGMLPPIVVRPYCPDCVREFCREVKEFIHEINDERVKKFLEELCKGYDVVC